MMEAGSRQALQIFFCYASQDKPLRDELEAHLSALKQQGFISIWSEQTLRSEKNWAQEIEKCLNTNPIILLLISPDFMASDYCYGIQMQHAVKRHERNEACVIPIILRSAEWHHAPFGHLRNLPCEGLPVTARIDLDEGLSSVAKDFRNLLKDRLLYRKQQEGDALAMLNHYEEALLSYEQALQLDPENVSLYVLKGEILRSLKRFEEALHIYDQAIQLAQEHSIIPYLCKGELLCDLQRYNESLMIFAQATRLISKNSDATQDTTRDEFYWKVCEKAFVVYERSLHQPPRTPVGKEDQEEKQQEVLPIYKHYESLFNCYEALQYNPTNPVLHKKKGDLLLEAHWYIAAMLAYEQALDLQPDFTPAHLGLSLSLEKLGRDISGKLKYLARHLSK